MQIDTNIYCLATGKIIANISDDEFGVILASVAHLPQNARQTHIDRLVLMSMRPSLAWMSVTPQSLDSLREAAPKELLAYLLNRLYASTDIDRRTGKPLNTDSWLAARRMRIQMWEAIDSATFDSEQLDTLLLILLELDSRFSLAKLIKPQSVTSAWQLVDVPAMILALTQWRDPLVAAQVKADRLAAHAREFWSEGNRLTRKAFAGQFDKVRPHTPLVSMTPTAVERRAKGARIKDDVDFLNQLENELAGMSQPMIVAPVVKKITRFGVKSESL